MNVINEEDITVEAAKSSILIKNAAILAMRLLLNIAGYFLAAACVIHIKSMHEMKTQKMLFSQLYLIMTNNLRLSFNLMSHARAVNYRSLPISL